jgi:hypothetical protein
MSDMGTLSHPEATVSCISYYAEPDWMVECRSNSCCTFIPASVAPSMVEYEVSKRMPADLPNCGPYRCRPQITLQGVLLPSGPASAVCEDPPGQREAAEKERRRLHREAELRSEASSPPAVGCLPSHSEHPVPCRWHGCRPTRWNISPSSREQSRPGTRNAALDFGCLNPPHR